MEKYNYNALLGLLFGTMFIVNGLWKTSPFMIPYFRRIQEERLGPKGLMVRLVGTGVVIIVLSMLAFFKIIFAN